MRGSRSAYAGKYTDFSQHGWESGNFNAQACWNAAKPAPAPAPAQTVPDATLDVEEEEGPKPDAAGASSTPSD